MSYIIYKLMREDSRGGASGAYSINREESWRLVKVNEGDETGMRAELLRLTRTDPEWRRWGYSDDDDGILGYACNSMAVHKRMYHMVPRGGLSALRDQIKTKLMDDGVEVVDV